jgi:hypothetical protein
MIYLVEIRIEDTEWYFYLLEASLEVVDHFGGLD